MLRLCLIVFEQVILKQGEWCEAGLYVFSVILLVSAFVC